MKIYTHKKRYAAEVLAGRTGYDEVEYRGVTFRRPLAVHEAGKNGDISVNAAIRYINSVLDKQE